MRLSIAYANEHDLNFATPPELLPATIVLYQGHGWFSTLR